MPIYEYNCTKCGKSMEVLQPMSAVYTKCSQIDSSCNGDGTLEKKFSQFAVSGSAVPDAGPCGAPCDPQSGGGHQHSGGCCCSGDMARSKYGLN